MPERVNATPEPAERTPAPPALIALDASRVLALGPGLVFRVVRVERLDATHKPPTDSA